MATATVAVESSTAGPPTLPPARTINPAARLIRWVRNHIIHICGTLALLYLFLPVFVVVAFSFNDPAGRYNYVFSTFSFSAWTDPCKDPAVCDAVTTSLTIAAITTVVATFLGTLMAFAIGRHKFRGRALINLIIFMPMATPEVVMGASLLALFVNLGLEGELGIVTITIAHIMFSISFVVVTVKARIAGLDPRLEQAAMDLYADERTTFRKVTFPLTLPGIVAAALLAFSLSFDDFVITNFTSGQLQTFPLFVYGANQRGLPPEANVVGAAVFLIALIIVLLPELSRRRSKSSS